MSRRRRRGHALRRRYGRAAGVAATIDTTRGLRDRVAADLRPLFDHLLNLAASDVAGGHPQSAGRYLRKARKLAGETAPMRPTRSSEKMSRRALGLRMTQWHSSMGDPYYAVGSFYLSDQRYPDRAVVERALHQAEEDERRAEIGAHGLTKRDAGSFRAIARGLRYYLRHDYGGAA